MVNKSNIFEIESNDGDTYFFKFGCPFMTKKVEKGFVDIWIDGKGIKEEYSSQFPNVVSSSDVEGMRQEMNSNSEDSLEIGLLSLFPMDIRGEHRLGVLNTTRKKEDGLYSIITVNLDGFKTEEVHQISCTNKSPSDEDIKVINKFIIYGSIVNEIKQEEIDMHCLINEIKDKCNRGDVVAVLPKLENVL